MLLIALLLAALAHRLILALAALRPRRRRAAGALPTVQILVAARNEQANLPAFLEALGRLDYDPAKLSFVLVSDGSEDGTPSQFRAWARRRPRVQVIVLDSHRGKSAALEAAWRHAPGAELTAFFDADVRPAPKVLRLLAGEFSAPDVGAASGAVLPLDSEVSLVSRYAALELWVFHRVIQPGRDRLGLNPPAIGANRIIRTAALAAVGACGSRPSDSEDLETSFALVRAGWRTRFREDAVVATRTPATLGAFLAQRRRWASGTFRSAFGRPSPGSLATAAGYLERILLLALCLGAVFGSLAWWWPLLYLAGPAAHVAVALLRARVRRPARYLLAAVAMLAIDVGVTVYGLARSIVSGGGRPATTRWN